MYTSLERNRLYRIGIGDDAVILQYTHREFPDDHPPLFHFIDVATGEELTFILEQLTILEQKGGIEYIGAAL